MRAGEWLPTTFRHSPARLAKFGEVDRYYCLVADLQGDYFDAEYVRRERLGGQEIHLVIALHTLLARMTEIERDSVIGYYGLDGESPATLSSLARGDGARAGRHTVTAPRIGQARDHAMQKLRRLRHEWAPFLASGRIARERPLPDARDFVGMDPRLILTALGEDRWMYAWPRIVSELTLAPLVRQLETLA